MNKFLSILFLITTFCFGQNDSLHPKEEVMFDTENIKLKEFSPKFNEKYTSNEFQYETKVDDSKLSAWNRFWKSVGDFFRELFDFSNADGTLTGLSIFMKIIAFIIIGFVIFMIVKIIINKEGGWVFGKSSKNIKVSDLVEENIHTIDFKKLITDSKSEKEFRTSIRYYYLWLLKSMSDKNIIEWDIEKTNSDYLYEIKNPEIKSEFQFLSYIYEYSWYGEFAVSETDFQKVEKSFLKAIQN
ncbi:DUF4129 domain-containing protein [uncultured Flavobacterium sp.]|uniref:DUF4129 domain-containing protein n=1 Tax=uncultured Flavobacterium sp. TaxID=165435 RepID=UPI0030C8D16D